MKAREGTVTGSEFSTGNLHKQVTSSPGLILMQSLSLYVCVYVCEKEVEKARRNKGERLCKMLIVLFCET